MPSFLPTRGSTRLEDEQPDLFRRASVQTRPRERASIKEIGPTNARVFHQAYYYDGILSENTGDSRVLLTVQDLNGNAKTMEVSIILN